MLDGAVPCPRCTGRSPCSKVGIVTRTRDQSGVFLIELSDGSRPSPPSRLPIVREVLDIEIPATELRMRA
jgi:hypothetical protein